MWEDDSQIEALANLIEASYAEYSKFLETMWKEYQSTRSPNLGILFAFGKFSSHYMSRKEMVVGEDTRELLHQALNATLKDKTVNNLVQHLTKEASKRAFGGE